MNSRRSFFKSLALLGAAAGCPGLFIPKLEPVRWKVVGLGANIYPIPYDYDQVQKAFSALMFAGTWRWANGPLLVIDAPTVYAVKPEPKEFVDCFLHVRDS